MKAPDESVFAIVGLGLMGGSLALALRAGHACREILAVERDPDVCARALARGAADQASTDLALVAQADIVVLAAPVRTILAQIPQVGQQVRTGAIVLDLGSTKREIARAMELLPESIQAIGGHPMCGKEVAGFDAADAQLFRGAPFVLTPLARTEPSTIGCAETIARSVGARPLILDAARHDRIVATTSHLPFALAALLMTTAEDLARQDKSVFTLAASGFRDTSRLAASDTRMMSDVLLTNSHNVAGVLRDYGRHLDTLAEVIEREDEAALSLLLQSAATRRRELYRV